MASRVNLVINDKMYGGWLDVSVSISIENLAGSFTLSLTDRWTGQDEQVVIRPTDSCVVLINDTVVITGYVDAVNLTLDGSNHTITITGRDKTADLIDCSIINGTGQYKNLNLQQIATRICEPFGIEVVATVNTGAIFTTFNVEQGSTAYESLQKLCSARQCLAMSDGSGNLLITRTGEIDASTPIVEGINMKSGTAAYDNSLRYNKYIVKGQLQGLDDGDVETTAGNMATSTDDGIARYRPLVVVADGQANSADCQKRADWERNTRKGRSRRYSVVTSSWLQALGGELWQLNQLVTLQSQALGVFDKLLIVGITFSLDTSGELTTLELTSPDAYMTIETLPVDEDLNPYLQVS